MNDKIINQNGAYEIFLYSDAINNDKEYTHILSLQINGKPVLRTTYLLMGRYLNSQNIWIWGDKSLQTSKIITRETKNLRNKLKKSQNDELIKFAQNDISIMTKDELDANFVAVTDELEQNAILDVGSTYVTVFLINKVLFNNSKNLNIVGQ